MVLKLLRGRAATCHSSKSLRPGSSKGGRSVPKSARGRRLYFLFSRLFCLGDPNVGTRLRSLHVRNALRRLSWDSVLDAGCSLSGQVGWGGGIAVNPLLLARFNPSRFV